jgi:hypothetical protein
VLQDKIATLPDLERAIGTEVDLTVWIPDADQHFETMSIGVTS